MILQSHGLFTWGDSPKQCHETTIETIQIAMDLLALKEANTPTFGGPTMDPRSSQQQQYFATKLMPKIRGLICQNLGETASYKVGHFDDGDAALQFVRAIPMDVTNEHQVIDTLTYTAAQFGGWIYWCPMPGCLFGADPRHKSPNVESEYQRPYDGVFFGFA